jgi:shikimate kinase
MPRVNQPGEQTPESVRPPPNLILVGFMGTGKSTLGRHLAQRWRRRFIDSDHEIERLARMKIPDIFAQKGEAEFRRLERDWVENHMPAGGCVIATGGGLVVPEGMAELLKSKGVVVCLFATPETVYRRTSGSSHRPLLQTENPMERIRALLAAREPAYLRAGIAVLTDGRNLPDLSAAVERVYFRAIRNRRARAQGGRAPKA